MLAAKVEGAAVVVVDKPSIFTNLTKPLVFEPVFLTIEKIGLTKVQIVEVGVDDVGRLEVPQSFGEVGWYVNGPKAGEDGNAILAGHYDRVGGSPAVFYNLVKLSVGDSVVVEDQVQKEHTFLITEVVHVNVNDPESVLKAYEQTKDSVLTIITCGGVWDPVAHDYSKRLLIKAKKV